MLRERKYGNDENGYDTHNNNATTTTAKQLSLVITIIHPRLSAIFRDDDDATYDSNVTATTITVTTANDNTRLLCVDSLIFGTVRRLTAVFLRNNAFSQSRSSTCFCYLIGPEITV